MPRIPVPFVLLGAAVVLCLGVAGVMISGRMERRPTVPAPAPASARPVPHTAARPAAGPHADSERAKPAISLEFTRPSELLSRLRPLLEEDGSDTALEDAQGALERYVAGDPKARALELLDLLKQESDERLMEILAGAVGSDEGAANDPAVVQGFLSVARDDAETTRRLQAMLFLSDVMTVPPWLSEQMADLARTEADADVRAMAITALNAYLDEGADGREKIVGALVEIARSDANKDNRKAALEKLTARDFGPAAIDGLLQILRTDASPGTRKRAARALGDPAPALRSRAVDELERAFLAESDPGVRKEIVRSLVDAGRQDAIESLRRLAPVDPKQTQDINDYVEILGTGETDKERIAEFMRARKDGRKTKDGGKKTQVR